MVDEKGRKFELISDHLGPRDPLSTMVKIDIEGTEWEVIESMTDADLSKIVQLDFEIHFCVRVMWDGQVLPKQWTRVRSMSSTPRASTSTSTAGLFSRAPSPNSPCWDSGFTQAPGCDAKRFGLHPLAEEGGESVWDPPPSRPGVSGWRDPMGHYPWVGVCRHHHPLHDTV